MDDVDRKPEDFFEGFPENLAMCHQFQRAVAAIGEARARSRFRRRKGFAYVWRPGQYVDSDVPAVLSIALTFQIRSDRFKEVVHPSANLWMEDLELRETGQIDHEVRAWLALAYAHAG